MRVLVEILVVGMAAAAVVLTISRSRIFRFLRLGVKRIPLVGALVHELVTCPYCLSHWVVGAYVLVERPSYGLTRWVALDCIVFWGATIIVSTLLVSGVYNAVKKIGAVKDES